MAIPAFSVLGDLWVVRNVNLHSLPLENLMKGSQDDCMGIFREREYSVSDIRQSACLGWIVRK